MNFISSQNRRTLVAVFVMLFVVCEVIAYVTTTPRPTEQFLSAYVLGSNHQAGSYYPGDDPDISIGETVTWYLGVTDNMGTVQLVSLRVKISNETGQPPGDQQQSPAPVVTEFPRFIQNNDTWEVPFAWSISNATLTDGSTRIHTMQINNETYQISDWSAANGYNFRLIIEVWTYQSDSNSFGYGWSTNGGRQAAWLQVWFNMTQLGPHA